MSLTSVQRIHSYFYASLGIYKYIDAGKEKNNRIWKSNLIISKWHDLYCLSDKIKWMSIKVQKVEQYKQ